MLIEKVGGVLQVSAVGTDPNPETGTTSSSSSPKTLTTRCAPATYMLIDVPGTVPGDIDDVIEFCMDASSACAQIYSVLTGSHNGPVKAGIKNLIGCPTPDVYLGPGRYQRPDGTVGSTSRALVTCPDLGRLQRYHPRHWRCAVLPRRTRSPGEPIRQLQIVGFATIFVEGLRAGNSPYNRL